jgi:hypothetical protein
MKNNLCVLCCGVISLKLTEGHNEGVLKKREQEQMFSEKGFAFRFDQYLKNEIERNTKQLCSMSFA